MNLANLALTPYSYRQATYAAEQVSWHAWNGGSRTSCLPALTETTPDGQRRSRTVLLRDAERRIRLGYLNEQFEWRVLGQAQDNWTDQVTHWHEKAMIYRHKKTGNLYAHLGYGTDCTNGERDGTQVVLYRPLFHGYTVYVRDRAEHEEKFEVVADDHGLTQSPSTWWNLPGDPP